MMPVALGRSHDHGSGDGRRRSLSVLLRFGSGLKSLVQGKLPFSAVWPCVAWLAPWWWLPRARYSWPSLPFLSLPLLLDSARGPRWWYLFLLEPSA